MNEKKKEKEIGNNHLIPQYKITAFTLSLSTSSSSCLLSCWKRSLSKRRR